MIRVDYHLAEPQLKRLRAISKATGLSVAELIRRAIDRYLEEIPSGVPKHFRPQGDKS